MFPHGPPGFVGSTKGDTPEHTNSFGHLNQSFYAEPESVSLLKLFVDSRKRSRSSEPESRNKRRKHGHALIAGSPSDHEPGSPDNPIDVDRAAPGSSENPLLVGDEGPPDIPDGSQPSTEEDSQCTVLQKPSGLQQQQTNAVAENSSISTHEKVDNREHNDPAPPATLASNGFRESLISARGNVHPAITPTVLGQTSVDGTGSSVTNLVNDFGPTTDRDVLDVISHYGILGHRWANDHKLEVLVLQSKWMPANTLERDNPCLVNRYKQDKKITAL